MLAFGGQQRQRRRRIHRGDELIKAEHLRPSLKQTGVKDAIKRPVSPHQFCSALWPNSRRAGQLVGRIAPKRNEVWYLFRIDAVPLPDLIRPHARNFAAPHRVEDCCGWRGELKRVPIAARNQRGTACALLGGDRGGEKVVRLEPWGFGVRKPACGDKFRE